MNSENEKNIERFSDELTFQEFIQGLAYIFIWLRRHILRLILCIILSISIFLFWQSRKEDKFSAQLSFILNDDSNSQVSNLSGLLGQLGLPIPTGKYNVDKLLEIAKSRRLLSSTLFQKKKINEKEDFLANHFLEIYDLPEKWSQKQLSFEGFSFESNAIDSFDLKERFALKALHNLIMGSPENRSSALFSTDYGRSDYIMTFTSTTLSDELSIYFTNEMYDQVERFFAQESEKGAELYNLILYKRDSLVQAMNSITYQIALEKDKNFGTFRNTNNVELAKLETKLIGHEAAYREVEKNLNNAELALKSNTPLIRLLDRPIPPLQKIRTNYFRTLVIATIFGIALFMISQVFTQVFQLVQNKSKN